MQVLGPPRGRLFTPGHIGSIGNRIRKCSPASVTTTSPPRINPGVALTTDPFAGEQASARSSAASIVGAFAATADSGSTPQFRRLQRTAKLILKHCSVPIAAVDRSFAFRSRSSFRGATSWETAQDHQQQKARDDQAHGLPLDHVRDQIKKPGAFQRCPVDDDARLVSDNERPRSRNSADCGRAWLSCEVGAALPLAIACRCLPAITPGNTARRSSRRTRRRRHIGNQQRPAPAPFWSALAMNITTTKNIASPLANAATMICSVRVTGSRHTLEHR